MKRIFSVALVLFVLALPLGGCGSGTKGITHLRAEITRLTQQQVELESFVKTEIATIERSIETIKDNIIKEQKAQARAYETTKWWLWEAEQRRHATELRRLDIQLNHAEGRLAAYRRVLNRLEDYHKGLQGCRPP